VFSWSYAHLPSDVARFFRFLGLHQIGDVTADGLAALVDAPVPDAQRALRVLAQQHLVRETRPGRYAMHSLLRAYARELAVATDPEQERAAAMSRVRATYVRSLSQPDHRGGQGAPSPSRELSRAAGIGS